MVEVLGGALYHAEMGKTSITVSLDAELVMHLDSLVQHGRVASRSQAVEVAVADHVRSLRRAQLADACAGLDPELYGFEGKNLDFLVRS